MPLEYMHLMGPIMGILITVVVLVVTFKVFGKVFKQQRENALLLQTGARAQARVLTLQDTGVQINHQPQVMIAVEVYPQGGQPFQSTMTQVISMIQMPSIQPGAMIFVRYDPMNPARMAFEGPAGPPMGAGMGVPMGQPMGQPPMGQPPMY